MIQSRLAALCRAVLLASGLALAPSLVLASDSGGHQHGGHGGHGGHGSSAAGLASTSPGDGETVPASLDRIVLNFDHPMKVESIQLSTSAMERIGLDFTPSAEPVDRVAVPVDDLEPGDYEVAWRATGADHQMSGSFRFTVQ